MIIGPEFQLAKPNTSLDFLAPALEGVKFDGWAMVDRKAGLLALGDIGELSAHPLRESFPNALMVGISKEPLPPFYG